MAEFDEGKDAFLQVVKALDPAVEVVMPVTPSRGLFLVSLTKSGQRKFLTVNEDDILDLPEDADVLKHVTDEIRKVLASLPGTDAL